MRINLFDRELRKDSEKRGFSNFQKLRIVQEFPKKKNRENVRYSHYFKLIENIICFESAQEPTEKREN